MKLLELQPAQKLHKWKDLKAIKQIFHIKLQGYHCRRRQSGENPSNVPPPQGSTQYQGSL